MGTGDYICITVRGGAPWGFRLREGEGDNYRYLQVFQVEEGGGALRAGVCEGDEVVSLNGEPCADLTLPEANALLNAPTDCLQLLVKRCCSLTERELKSDETYLREAAPSAEALTSTTLRILSPGAFRTPAEPCIPQDADEAYFRGAESDPELTRGTALVRTQLCIPASGERRRLEPLEERGQPAFLREYSPGAMVELQMSLSQQTLEGAGSTSLGSARGIEGAIQTRESEAIHTTTHSLYIPCPAREPLGQHGVVLSSPSMLGMVEVTLQRPEAERL